MPTYGIQGNLVPDWDFSSPAAGPPNANWTGWVETETAGGGAATVEAINTTKRFGAYCCELKTTADDSEASILSAAAIAVDKTKHYVFRYSHYKVSGADDCNFTIKQYSAAHADLGDDITVTPTGAAAWTDAMTVIHPAGEGGNDFHANCTEIKVFVTVTTTADWYVDGISFAPCEGEHMAAFGTQLFIGGYPIAELTSINGCDVTRDMIEATSHDSPDQAKEYIAGLIEGGDVPIEGNLVAGDTNGQVVLEGDVIDGGNPTYHIILPAAVAEWRFSGYASHFATVADHADALKFSASVKVTGKPTLTEASFA